MYPCSHLKLVSYLTYPLEVWVRSILTPVSIVVRKQEGAYLSGRGGKACFQLGSFRFSPHLAQQVCIVPHDLSCEWMIRSGLFPDAQGALVQRLSLVVFALLFVEDRQPVQRIGHLGMVRSQGLFHDAQDALVQRLSLGVLALHSV